MTLHYLHLVGEAGRTRLSKLVMHVPFADPTTKEKSNEEENQTSAHDVIKACYDYEMQQEAESICRVRGSNLGVVSLIQMSMDRKLQKS